MAPGRSDQMFGLRIGRDPAGLRMELAGDLDVLSAGFLQTPPPAMLTGVGGIVVDLSGLEFVDLAGLRSLSRLQRELAAAQMPVRVTGAPAPLRRLARLVKSLWEAEPLACGDEAPCLV